jgi:hypothetical protein
MPGVTTYPLKAVTAEALQFDETNAQAFVDWLVPLGYKVQLVGSPTERDVMVWFSPDPEEYGLFSKARLEGGYWIVRRGDSAILEYLPDDQFRARYEVT